MIRVVAILLAFSLPTLAVDGVAINVTTGKPQAGVYINLVQPSQNGMVQLGKTITDAQGQFKIPSRDDRRNCLILKSKLNNAQLFGIE